MDFLKGLVSGAKNLVKSAASAGAKLLQKLPSAETFAKPIDTASSSVGAGAGVIGRAVKKVYDFIATPNFSSANRDFGEGAVLRARQEELARQANQEIDFQDIFKQKDINPFDKIGAFTSWAFDQGVEISSAVNALGEKIGRSLANRYNNVSRDNANFSDLYQQELQRADTLRKMDVFGHTPFALDTPKEVVQNENFFTALNVASIISPETFGAKSAEKLAAKAATIAAEDAGTASSKVIGKAITTDLVAASEEATRAAAMITESVAQDIARTSGRQATKAELKDISVKALDEAARIPDEVLTSTDGSLDSIITGIKERITKPEQVSTLIDNITVEAGKLKAIESEFKSSPQFTGYQFEYQKFADSLPVPVKDMVNIAKNNTLVDTGSIVIRDGKQILTKTIKETDEVISTVKDAFLKVGIKNREDIIRFANESVATAGRLEPNGRAFRYLGDTNQVFKDSFMSMQRGKGLLEARIVNQSKVSLAKSVIGQTRKRVIKATKEAIKKDIFDGKSRNVSSALAKRIRAEVKNAKGIERSIEIDRRLNIQTYTMFGISQQTVDTVISRLGKNLRTKNSFYYDRFIASLDALAEDKIIAANAKAEMNKLSADMRSHMAKLTKIVTGKKFGDLRKADNELMLDVMNKLQSGGTLISEDTARSLMNIKGIGIKPSIEMLTKEGFEEIASRVINKIDIGQSVDIVKELKRLSIDELGTQIDFGKWTSVNRARYQSMLGKLVGNLYTRVKGRGAAYERLFEDTINPSYHALIKKVSPLRGRAMILPKVGFKTGYQVEREVMQYLTTNEPAIISKIEAKWVTEGIAKEATQYAAALRKFSDMLFEHSNASNVSVAYRQRYVVEITDSKLSAAVKTVGNIKENRLLKSAIEDFASNGRKDSLEKVLNKIDTTRVNEDVYKMALKLTRGEAADTTVMLNMLGNVSRLKAVTSSTRTFLLNQKGFGKEMDKAYGGALDLEANSEGFLFGFQKSKTGNKLIKSGDTYNAMRSYSRKVGEAIEAREGMDVVASVKGIISNAVSDAQRLGLDTSNLEHSVANFDKWFKTNIEGIPTEYTFGSWLKSASPFTQTLESLKFVVNLQAFGLNMSSFASGVGEVGSNIGNISLTLAKAGLSKNAWKNGAHLSSYRLSKLFGLEIAPIGKEIAKAMDVQALEMGKNIHSIKHASDLADYVSKAAFLPLKSGIDFFQINQLKLEMLTMAQEDLLKVAEFASEKGITSVLDQRIANKLSNIKSMISEGIDSHLLGAAPGVDTPTSRLVLTWNKWLFQWADNAELTLEQLIKSPTKRREFLGDTNIIREINLANGRRAYNLMMSSAAMYFMYTAKDELKQKLNNSEIKKSRMGRIIATAFEKGLRELPGPIGFSLAVADPVSGSTSLEEVTNQLTPLNRKFQTFYKAIVDASNTISENPSNFSPIVADAMLKVLVEDSAAYKQFIGINKATLKQRDLERDAAVLLTLPNDNGQRKSYRDSLKLSKSESQDFDLMINAKRNDVPKERIDFMLGVVDYGTGDKAYRIVKERERVASQSDKPEETVAAFNSDMNKIGIWKTPSGKDNEALLHSSSMLMRAKKAGWIDTNLLDKIYSTYKKNDNERFQRMADFVLGHKDNEMARTFIINFNDMNDYDTARLDQYIEETRNNK